MLEWVRKFSPYDLYSERDTRPKLKTPQPYNGDPVAEFFPKPIRW